MKYVTRASWGARTPKCVAVLPAIDAIVIHYSAMDADEQIDHTNCAARVKGIQRYHIETKGWCDIAYNWLVCKHGYVFAGREYHRSGATGNDNSHTVAVCFLGDDTVGRDDATDAGRQAIIDIVQAVQKRLGKRLLYRGHRDYMGTACPGNELYSFIRSDAFVNKVNDQEEEVELVRIKELEELAKTYAKTAKSPGPLPEAERNIFWSQARCAVWGLYNGDAKKLQEKLDAIEAILNA